MKVLIVKLGAIGDIVHTLPALAAIRESLPESRVSWAVEKRSAEILRGNPLIDELVEVDTRQLRGVKALGNLAEAGKQLRAIKSSGFDVAIDFQGLVKSAVISKLSGAKRRWGFARRQLREPAGRVFLTDTAEIPEGGHVIEKNVGLAVQALGIRGPNGRFRFPLATEETHRQEALRMIGEAGAKFAILNPAGGWRTKLWPAERFGRLADAIWERHGLTSLVATGPKEKALAEAVTGSSRSGKAVAVSPSLKGFYELARKASVYVGGDTGPTHLAVAAGTPIVGIFGPTEWWRNGSPNANDICVERLDIGCRTACHRRKCSNWICMDIGVDTVAAAVSQRLAAAENENRGIG